MNLGCALLNTPVPANPPHSNSNSMLRVLLRKNSIFL